jgi:hypothetical protein
MYTLLNLLTVLYHFIFILSSRKTQKYKTIFAFLGITTTYKWPFYQLKVASVSTVLGIYWVEVPNDSVLILGISDKEGTSFLPFLANTP